VVACKTHLRREADAGALDVATSVFFGGGTPSQLPPELLGELLEEIPRRPGAEVTVECNPDDVTPAMLVTFRGAGVTRISLGIQSMASHVLRGLGRSHDPEAVVRSVALVGAAGFERFSVDLIFGGAGETEADWVSTLEGAMSLEPAPAHVSAYALTVEPGTPLASEPSRHPDEDMLAHRYRVADDMLSRAGLEWYEISNWALPGQECRHNLLYWEQGNYLGIGCAAHSHRDGRRWWNVRRPERYITAIAEGRSPVCGEERLDERERRFESKVLGLRTREGLRLSEVSPDPDLDGLVHLGRRATLTLSGRLLANEVAARLE
ncbi:MAG: radical SAM family heme chaperone HemW, partial [Acidimicrobiales bacterium]